MFTGLNTSDQIQNDHVRVGVYKVSELDIEICTMPATFVRKEEVA